MAHVLKLNNCPLCKASIINSRNAAPNYALKDGAIEYQRILKKLQFYEDSLATPLSEASNNMNDQTTRSVHNQDPPIKAFELSSPAPIGAVRDNVRSNPLQSNDFVGSLFSIGAPPATRKETVKRSGHKRKRNLSSSMPSRSNFTCNNSTSNTNIFLPFPFQPLGNNNFNPFVSNPHNSFESRFSEGEILFSIGSNDSTIKRKF